MKNKILVFIFVMALSFFSIATFLLPDKTFSVVENRYLETRPKADIKSIVDGSFEEKFETYAADQVVLKDTFVAVKSDMEFLAHKQGLNGVYFAKGGRYVKAYDPDLRQYDENLQFIDDYVDYFKDDIPIAFLLAPNVQSIYEDCLPSNVYMGDYNADFKRAADVFKDITFVNPTDILREHKSEDIYFRTDHHWTMRGAYYAYSELLNAMGVTPHSVDEYDVRTVADDFYGSLYSKAPLSFIKADKIEVFDYPLGTYRVTFEDSEVMHNLFANSKLFVKDKYTYFLDGNHQYVRIESLANTGRKALVFKDSYSHSLLPFLADHYDEIDVVDLRYYHEDVKTLTEGGDYDQVFMIYNLDFLTSDTNFIWMDVK